MHGMALFMIFWPRHLALRRARCPELSLVPKQVDAKGICTAEANGQREAGWCAKSSAS